MKEETGYFLSFDGTKLFYRAWEKDTPKALLIVHGFGEHSGRYGEFIEALHPLPYSIFTCDLRGHGHSEGKRVYVDRFEHFVEDLYRFRTFLEDKKPGLNRDFVLLGQSMGGLIASLTVLRNQSKWRALILLSPFFRVSLGHSFLEGFTRILNLVVPNQVWANPIRPLYLTHDLEELRRYKQDPLVQRRISIHLAHEMFQGCAKTLDRLEEISLPVLLLVSGDDRIVSVKKTRRVFEKIRAREKRIEVFDGCFHELLHEKDRAKPISVIKDYISNLGL